ncbi:flavin-containing monooxygenase FMO GS-OX4-like isoform X2 [Photinus pyralis]|uniref:flavin-containing monooxygenase FMO GS-OX4-like isoform X2 n=1 Tax=Photinus pyralis TaxID=7054 RepID=UPI0012674B34|nr:flavin-containing monooxygenase FMO GS-OX4-like isoform X2 [Photinus pyralis]
MKVAVVGAGPAGLVAAKYSVQHGHECDVFEQTGAFGGVWIYTDDVGVDKEGVLIHTSMYKDLTTNFPKELMSYPDCAYPDDQTKSYISQQEVLGYLKKYVDEFNIKRLIQFYTRVVDISPDVNEGWIIKTEDVKSNLKKELVYDAVLICNGRFYEPTLPKINGQDLFKGPQTHSKDFRTPEPFKDQTVLIVGGSYSGQELCLKIAPVAKRVILSHRAPIMYIKFPDNLTEKTEVAEFTANGARFLDDTIENFDCILYCTGFHYVCPFVSKKCGLNVDNNWIRPLYKQIINVEYPTMHFIGLPYVACGIPLFDFQFSLAALEKKFNLPSKEEMIKELGRYMDARRAKGIPDFQAHKLGNAEAQTDYLQQLSDVSGIPPIRPVINKLYARIKACVTLGCRFEIVDDENFRIIS